MNIRNEILKLKGLLLGFTPVKCRVCGKLTEPSIIVGNICSMDCINKEDKNDRETVSKRVQRKAQGR